MTDTPVLVAVHPDDLALIVELLDAMGGGEEVLDELLAAVADDAVELPMETVEEVLAVLDGIDLDDGLHLGGIGRALAEPLERAVERALGAG